MNPSLTVPILTKQNFLVNELDLGLPDKNEDHVHTSAVYYKDDALYIQTAMVGIAQGTLGPLDAKTMELIELIDDRIKHILVQKSTRMFKGKKFDMAKISSAYRGLGSLALDESTKVFNHRGSFIDYDDHIKEGQCILELTDLLFVGATILPQWRISQFRAASKQKTVLPDYAFVIDMPGKEAEGSEGQQEKEDEGQEDKGQEEREDQEDNDNENFF